MSNVPHNGVQQLTATGTYSDASTADLTSQCEWLSSDTAVCTVGNGEDIPPPPQPANPGFETGTLGTQWFAVNTAGVFSGTLYGYTPHSGNYAAYVGDNGGFANVSSLQRAPGAKIAVPAAVAGLTYILHVWCGFFKHDFGIPQGEQKGEVLDQFDNPIATLFDYTTPIDGAGVWSEFTCDVTAYAGTVVQLKITSHNAGGGPYNPVLVDDLSLEISPTTNPKGLARGAGSIGEKCIIIAKFPDGVAGTTTVTLT